MSVELLAPLVIGFLGSLHCLGMCGPLVVACSLHAGACREGACAPFGREGLVRHGAFHLGRLLSYGALGALSASLFEAAELSRIFFEIRIGMSFFGGALLLLLGLILLKVIPFPSWLAYGPLSSRLMPSLIRSHKAGSRLALGMAAGLIPCCLLWAMIVTAAATRSPFQGFLTMTAFGLGTLPSLLLAGLSSSILSLKTRLWGERIAALSVSAMGIVLLLKGAGVLT